MASVTIIRSNDLVAVAAPAVGRERRAFCRLGARRAYSGAARPGPTALAVTCWYGRAATASNSTPNRAGATAFWYRYVACIRCRSPRRYDRRSNGAPPTMATSPAPSRSRQHPKHQPDLFVCDFCLPVAGPFARLALALPILISSCGLGDMLNIRRAIRRVASSRSGFFEGCMTDNEKRSYVEPWSNTPKALAAREKFWAAIGEAMAAWSSVEDGLFEWFKRCTGMQETLARAVFYSAKSFEDGGICLRPRSHSHRATKKPELVFASACCAPVNMLHFAIALRTAT